MEQKEKWVLIGVLGLVFLLIMSDIASDALEGVDVWHLVFEGSIGLLSLFGISYLLKDSFRAKKKITISIKESEKWRAEYKKYVEGLSSAIDVQLDKWGLTVAEKEVAFLLLKGLSLKEIAEVRNTTEKTARAQSMAVYSKAELSSRAELSAFFLEDLLVPMKTLGSPVHSG